MSYINNTKQTTMFQTTPQTHLIIKTEILVTLDGFLKVWLIIINNILDIVSNFFLKKITFVINGFSHNGITVEFLNFSHSPSTLK